MDLCNQEKRGSVPALLRRVLLSFLIFLKMSRERRGGSGGRYEQG